MRFQQVMKALSALVITASLTACVTDGLQPNAQVTSGSGPSMESARGERYDGPKARIAVAEFEDKMSSAGAYRPEYGRGMSDMLTTALFQTNRYVVLERQKLRSVMAEQNLGATGRIKQETAAKIGELEGAELLVNAAITGFDPGVSGIGATVGGFFGGAIGGLVGGVKTARVAMDLRVIDVNTGRIVAATSTEATASSFSGGLGGIGGHMGGGLTAFAKTPMESAIRAAIQKAVDFVVSQTPQNYYHFQ